jgi:hypothetical protein
MNRLFFFIWLFLSNITYAQVGVGNNTQQPVAGLDIVSTDLSSLFLIDYDGAKALDIKDTRIGIKKAAEVNVVDVDINNNTDLKIKVNLNSNYTSDALRLGINSQGDVCTTRYRIGDIIFKESKNTIFINNQIVRDIENQIFLTPGTYKMDILVRYTSMSTTDIAVGFVAPIDAEGYFTAKALYGTFTTTTAALDAIPFIYANIHDELTVLGGEDNKADRILNGNLSGFITIKTAGYVALRYKQQSLSSFDSTIYPLSYLKFERIQ